jgi:4-amino-4-deoxy-L-arabinose transferase-like glycosyltransferase
VKSRTLWLLLALVLGLRVATMGLYPLTDTTEARYAEMARKMVETGNWLTPMFDVGVPFWGKPPLSFWLSAVPMALAGASDFTARLGPLLAALGVMGLLGSWPHRYGRPRSFAVAAMLVFLSTPLGFIASAAVMTDMAMTAGTTLSMLAFWRAWSGTAPVLWRWLFFAGLAVGLMAKGPVAGVLTGVAVALFVLVQGWHAGWVATARRCWQALPWLRGALLTVALVAPWYLWAEQATPGFLRYFIVGEHWYRFTQSGWKGDLYGVAHAQPKGRIWLFGLLCTLPWVLLAAWWKLRRSAATWTWAPGESTYLWAWLLSPLLFFTLSGNILPAYVLPGLPAFALLAAATWQRAADARSTAWLAGFAGLLAPGVLTGLVLLQPNLFAAFSEQATLRQLASVPGELVYLYERPDSAVFYSPTPVRVIVDEAEAIRQLLAGQGKLVIPVRRLDSLGAQLKARCWRELGRSKAYAAFVPGTCHG